MSICFAVLRSDTAGHCVAQQLLSCSGRTQALKSKSDAQQTCSICTVLSAVRTLNFEGKGCRSPSQRSCEVFETQVQTKTQATLGRAVSCPSSSSSSDNSACVISWLSCLSQLCVVLDLALHHKQDNLPQGIAKHGRKSMDEICHCCLM